MPALAFTVLATVAVARGSESGALRLQAGAARVDITPPTGYPMWGYGARHDAPSEGVLDPLAARALVLAAGAQRIALVSMDLGRPPARSVTAAIEARVRAQAGIGHVLLVASHTHHGPVVELDDWPDAKHPYTDDLKRKISQAVIEAAGALRPARIGLAARQVNWNRNRHSRLADKPVDHELLALRVEDLAGNPIALAVNFAAHPVLQDPHLPRFSADYPGALAEQVEKAVGVPCIFLQGAAGDLSPDTHGLNGPGSYGRALAQEVLELAKTIRCTEQAQPGLQVREDDFRFAKRLDLGNPVVRTFYDFAFFPRLVDFYEREYRDGVRPRMTTALVNGSIGVVAVSGEFFCAHSLALKRRARLPYVWFLGYCNDYQQYFPTIEAAAEGGYGADPRVSPAEVGAGERMIDRALIRLYEMRGRWPDSKRR